MYDEGLAFHLMRKLKNRIPELIQRTGIQDGKRYLQQDMARGSGLSDAAVSRIMRYKTLDNVLYGHLFAIGNWLGVEDLRDLVKVVDK
jgi:transcriptional regulator with XRE-family HTH domain